MSKSTNRTIGKTEVQQKANRSFKSGINAFKFFQTTTNYYFLAGGVVLSIIGFYLSGAGNWDSSESLYIAPILLVIAYAVLFPLSILYKKKEPVKVSDNTPQNS